MKKLIMKSLSVVVSFIFILTTVFENSAYANMSIRPQSTAHLGLSSNYTPILMKGIQFNPENGLDFKFVLDRGDVDVSHESVELFQQSEKLIKYFLTALTIPEEDLWVNLSPYEENRITSNELSQTQMGRDLLAQDYILKKLTSSLLFPEGQEGREFWEKVYSKSYQELGITDLPIESFHKIWIMPDTAELYAEGQTVLITDSSLKVMLEEDYVAREYAKLDESQVSDLKHDVKQTFRDVVIPVIKEEVNQGEHFANLRQIYNALILAKWYKQNLKDSLLGQVYTDQGKISGQVLETAEEDIQNIYNRYVEAYKDGAEGVIKEDYDPVKQEMIARKYVTGGFVDQGELTVASDRAEIAKADSANLVVASQIFRLKTGNEKNLGGDLASLSALRKTAIFIFMLFFCIACNTVDDGQKSAQEIRTEAVEKIEKTKKLEIRYTDLSGEYIKDLLAQAVAYHQQGQIKLAFDYYVGAYEGIGLLTDKTQEMLNLKQKIERLIPNIDEFIFSIKKIESFNYESFKDVKMTLNNNKSFRLLGINHLVPNEMKALVSLMDEMNTMVSTQIENGQPVTDDQNVVNQFEKFLSIENIRFVLGTHQKAVAALEDELSKYSEYTMYYEGSKGADIDEINYYNYVDNHMYLLKIDQYFAPSYQLMRGIPSFFKGQAISGLTVKAAENISPIERLSSLEGEYKDFYKSLTSLLKKYGYTPNDKEAVEFLRKIRSQNQLRVVSLFNPFKYDAGLEYFLSYFTNRFPSGSQFYNELKDILQTKGSSFYDSAIDIEKNRNTQIITRIFSDEFRAGALVIGAAHVPHLVALSNLKQTSPLSTDFASLASNQTQLDETMIVDESSAVLQINNDQAMMNKKQTRRRFIKTGFKFVAGVTALSTLLWNCTSCTVLPSSNAPGMKVLGVTHISAKTFNEIVKVVTYIGNTKNIELTKLHALLAELERNAPNWREEARKQHGFYLKAQSLLKRGNYSHVLIEQPPQTLQDNLNLKTKYREFLGQVIYANEQKDFGLGLSRQDYNLMWVALVGGSMYGYFTDADEFNFYQSESGEKKPITYTSFENARLHGKSYNAEQTYKNQMHQVEIYYTEEFWALFGQNMARQNGGSASQAELESEYYPLVKKLRTRFHELKYDFTLTEGFAKDIFAEHYANQNSAQKQSDLENQALSEVKQFLSQEIDVIIQEELSSFFKKSELKGIASKIKSHILNSMAEHALIFNLRNMYYIEKMKKYSFEDQFLIEIGRSHQEGLDRLYNENSDWAGLSKNPIKVSKPETTGGIDLQTDEMNFETRGSGIDQSIQQNFNNIDPAMIQGIVPVNIQIAPLSSVFQLFADADVDSFDSPKQQSSDSNDSHDDPWLREWEALTRMEKLLDV